MKGIAIQIQFQRPFTSTNAEYWSDKIKGKSIFLWNKVFVCSKTIIKNFLGFYISITAWQEYVEKFNDTTLVIDVAKDSVQTFLSSYFIFMQL